MIGFRVDVNGIIATGHAMRCMAISEQLIRKGAIILFIVSDTVSKSFIAGRGYETLVLYNDFIKKDSEVDIIKDIIENYSIELLLVDSYEVTTYYLETVNIFCKVVYIDDYCTVPYSIFCVIQYSMGIDREKSDLLYQKSQTQRLVGSKYAPLRDEFIGIKPLIRPAVHDILLSIGGGEIGSYKDILCECLIGDNRFSSLSIHIMSRNLNDTKENCRIVTYKDPDVLSLMKLCDVGISASGTTLYELCACGLPTVSFSIADNQIPNANGFHKAGLIPYAGDLRHSVHETLEGIADNLSRFVTNYELRKQTSCLMHESVDSLGAQRIAEFITKEVE